MADVGDFDDLVLGGGEAGKYLAWEMAKLGRRTAVVERGLIGGSCPNIACLPGKNMIRSAKVAELHQRAAEFGVVTRASSTDMIGVRRRKREMVDSLIEIHRTRFKANGLEFMLGEGLFICSCARRRDSAPSKAVTSWSRPDARRTREGSGWRQSG